MSIQAQIESKLEAAFAPTFFEVLNESHMHNVPANSETHFQVTLASDAFAGLPKVRRHQLVYAELDDLLKGPVHALALHLFSPEEWAARERDVPASPNCRGGETQ